MKNLAIQRLGRYYLGVMVSGAWTLTGLIIAERIMFPPKKK